MGTALRLTVMRIRVTITLIQVTGMATGTAGPLTALTGARIVALLAGLIGDGIGGIKQGRGARRIKRPLKAAQIGLAIIGKKAQPSLITG